MSFITLYITHPDEATAKKISDQLLHEKLIACANIFPITSTYCWQSVIENEKEWVSLVKTAEYLQKEVEEKVLELHPYELPCIMCTTVSANEGYERWIMESVKKNS